MVATRAQRRRLSQGQSGQSNDASKEDPSNDNSNDASTKEDIEDHNDGAVTGIVTEAERAEALQAGPDTPMELLRNGYAPSQCEYCTFLGIHKPPCPHYTPLPNVEALAAAWEDNQSIASAQSNASSTTSASTKSNASAQSSSSECSIDSENEWEGCVLHPFNIECIRRQNEESAAHRSPENNRHDDAESRDGSASASSDENSTSGKSEEAESPEIQDDADSSSWGTPPPKKACFDDRSDKEIRLEGQPERFETAGEEDPFENPSLEYIHMESHDASLGSFRAVLNNQSYLDYSLYSYDGDGEDESVVTPVAKATPESLAGFGPRDVPGRYHASIPSIASDGVWDKLSTLTFVLAHASRDDSHHGDSNSVDTYRDNAETDDGTIRSFDSVKPSPAAAPKAESKPNPIVLVQQESLAKKRPVMFPFRVMVEDDEPIKMFASLLRSAASKLRK